MFDVVHATGLSDNVTSSAPCMSPKGSLSMSSMKVAMSVAKKRNPSQYAMRMVSGLSLCQSRSPNHFFVMTCHPPLPVSSTSPMVEA